MSERICTKCNETLPSDAFRKNSKGKCTWCQWEDKGKRAKARYRDKVNADKHRKTDDKRVNISEEEFIEWYKAQKDQCYYCGITMKEVKELLLKRGSLGYFVSWDIDRKDSLKPYQKDNIVLSCFMCNMAKASYFSEEEAMILGRAVRTIIDCRLKSLKE